MEDGGETRGGEIGEDKGRGDEGEARGGRWGVIQGEEDGSKARVGGRLRGRSCFYEEKKQSL